MNDLSAGKRYAAVVGDLYYGAPETALISTPDGRVTVLNRTLARVFEQCAVPRSAADHATLVSRTLRLSPADAACALRELAGARLLMEEPAGGVGPSTSVRPVTARIETVGIITADRPDALRRALASYLQNCREHDRAPQILVADGSRSSEDVATGAIGEVAKEQGAAVTHVGAQQRQALRRAVEAAGFPSDVVAWGLPDPPPRYAAGAVRNLLILATAGAPILSLDDDTSCSLRQLPSHQEGVSFVGHRDPRETRWFESRQESTKAGDPVNIDLIALHESVLGQDLRELHIASPVPCDMESACRHLAQALRGTQRTRVRATWLGVVGDAAQYCPHWNLFTTGTTRDRMASEENVFRLALSSREVARAVRQTTVTDESALMTYCAALDNSEMLPPFNPVGFNEDGLFGSLLRMCDPSAYIAQLPVAVVHDSTRSSEYEPRVPRSASQIRLAELIPRMMQPCVAGLVTQSPDGRVRNIGRHLCEWSRLDAAEFAWQLKRVALEVKWQILNQCEATAVSGFAYPQFWRQAISEYRAAICSSLADSEFHSPIEYAAHPDPEDRIEAVRRHVGMLGRLLVIWPDLWAWCARHKDWLN
jgi:hypothetical protein